MRNVSGTILRSAVAGALGLTMLLAPLALGRNDIASAQTATQVTLSLDSPNPGITVTNGQRVLVGGWAGAPGQRGSGISSVDVYLDGTTDLNAWQGEARLGIARQDVATTTRHPEWSNSGFNFEWMPRNVSQGTHTLYVVARSASGESATQTVQITGCGCGVSFQPSFTNPAVRRIGTLGWEIDTGGPGVFIQRDWEIFIFR